MPARTSLPGIVWLAAAALAGCGGDVAGADAATSRPDAGRDATTAEVDAGPSAGDAGPADAGI